MKVGFAGGIMERRDLLRALASGPRGTDPTQGAGLPGRFVVMRTTPFEPRMP